MNKFLKDMSFMNTCAYTWRAWNGFMFPCIYPFTYNVEAQIQQSNDEILTAIPPNTHYFLFNVNLTNTSTFYEDKPTLIEALQDREITPINHGVHDISKSHIQKVCLNNGLNQTKTTRKGDPEEQLIIKTDYNYGGNSEKKLSHREQHLLNVKSTHYDENTIYPVLRRKEIENHVWDDPLLFVERYISNSENLFYRVYKLFDRLVISEVIDENLIKKMPEGIPRKNAFCDIKQQQIYPEKMSNYGPLLTLLTRFCTAFKLDFGAIDVVVSDNREFYIIDVNTTPYWGGSGHPQLLRFLSGETEWSFLESS